MKTDRLPPPANPPAPTPNDPHRIRRSTRAAVIPAAVAWVLLAHVIAAAEPARRFVSPRGNDRWSGTLSEPNAQGTDGPWATLERARDAIRTLKTGPGLPAGGCIVELLAGRYPIGAPLELTAQDSGAPGSPIVYRAQPGARVILDGGQPVAGWRPVTDPALLDRLDPAARGNVFGADLKAFGIADYGDLDMDAAWELQRALSIADNQAEDEIGNAMASRKRVEEGGTITPRLEVFFNDTPMAIARWPNSGFTRIGKALGKTEIRVLSAVGFREGIFTYTDDRPSRWTREPHGFVKGYWSRDWATQCHRITSIDPRTRTLSVAPPYHYYGYRDGQWFLGFNLLCELDAPGEWYIDRHAHILYFWPPGPLETARADISLAPGLFTLNDVAHVTLHGLVMEHSRTTAVSLRNCSDCRVARCTVRNSSNHAVTIAGGQRCTVAGCDIYGMGGGGIYLIGGERATLTPAGHHADNNHIHHYARWDWMYRPAIFLSGVGLSASHNLIHHAPHAAILFGGQEHRIAHNEIHNVCREANDCGAIYAGRSWCLRGNVIQGNYLHHIAGREGGPSRGVYLDDEFSGAALRDNIFFQVMYAVFIGGGRDNLIENNVFVDCPSAFHIDARGIGWAAYAVEPRLKTARETGLLCGVRFREPPFSSRYPKLAALLDDEPAKPKGNIVRGNIFWRGAADRLRQMARRKPIEETWWRHGEPKALDLVRFENNLIDVDPGFSNANEPPFQLHPDSPACKLGVRPVDTTKIGLYPGPDRATWPVVHKVSPLPPPRDPAR